MLKYSGPRFGLRRVRLLTSTRLACGALMHLGGTPLGRPTCVVCDVSLRRETALARDCGVGQGPASWSLHPSGAAESRLVVYGPKTHTTGKMRRREANVARPSLRYGGVHRARCGIAKRPGGREDRGSEQTGSRGRRRAVQPHRGSEEGAGRPPCSEWQGGPRRQIHPGGHRRVHLANRAGGRVPALDCGLAGRAAQWGLASDPPTQFAAEIEIGNG